MPSHSAPFILLASPEPALLSAVGPILRAAGDHVDVALNPQSALAMLAASNLPDLILLDPRLPGMPVEQFLAAVRSQSNTARIPIVVVADAVTEHWRTRLAESAVDDIVLRSADPVYFQLRIDLALRSRFAINELETLREAVARNAQFDRLTGVYNRETFLAMLFRETDRAQRTNNDLSLVLFDVDDFGHWNSRLGAEACDGLLCQIANRVGPLLRSYDLLGRPGLDEFFIALPACGAANAVALAERLRAEVFVVPFRVADEIVRLSACFGIAVSRGRSPVIVLREAEKALEQAKAARPESIHCFGSASESSSPLTFLSSSSGDELLAW